MKRFTLLVLAGLVAACATPAGTKAEREWDVREALFRYQFEHNASGGQQSVGTYFLEVNGEDPPAEFVARFAGHEPPVEAASHAIASADEGVRHRERGGDGLIFRQQGLRWIGDRKAEVDGGYYEAGLSSSGNTYTVEWKGGRWVVTDVLARWIS